MNNSAQTCAPRRANNLHTLCPRFSSYFCFHTVCPCIFACLLFRSSIVYLGPSPAKSTDFLNCNIKAPLVLRTHKIQSLFFNSMALGKCSLGAFPCVFQSLLLFSLTMTSTLQHLQSISPLNHVSIFPTFFNGSLLSL